VGKIDELQASKDGDVTILEDKTKQSDTIPSESQSLTHKVQIMMYKKMTDDIIGGSYGFQNFARAYRTDGMALSEEFKRQLDTIKVEKNLQEVSKIAQRFFDAFASIGKINSNLHIRYINQFSGKEIKLYKFDYRKEEMDDITKYILKYWNGERESMPVPENEQWKCNYCVFFGKECKVWYKQKGL
jgi:exonuclease V